MSYLVLARKYRPQKFSEVIGQQHITELLSKSIAANRIAHSFLFCGPRGIGKTSCARILAKSLNCEKGPTINPCGECSACKEISQANSFDVLEIDGASNRGIDEIRSLRENVKFAPSYGRFKIYIVDEVHMLTMEAFNALLKTLEEPPPHVKFIFATTAPNKVPSTIISRCQRFDFKRITVQTTMDLLGSLCRQENFTIDQEALFAIAKASSGSLRDALSILDQLSSLSDRSIVASDVFSMLGLVETQLVFDMADQIGEKNCSGALEVLDRIIDQGKDIKQLTRDLTEHFRHLMIIKIGGKSLGRLVDYPVATKEMLLTQSEKFSLKDIMQSIETLIESQEISRITESLRMPLELAFAKLTYSEEKKTVWHENPIPAQVSRPQPVRTAESIPTEKPKTSPLAVIKEEKGSIHFSSPKTVVPVEEEVLEPTAGLEGEAVLLDLDIIKTSWNALTHAVSRERMSVATYLQEGIPYQFKGNRLAIGFSKEAVFQKESLEHNENLHLIQRIFSEFLKTKVCVDFKFVEDFKGQDDEPLVKSTLEKFNGKVVNKWHNG